MNNESTSNPSLDIPVAWDETDIAAESPTAMPTFKRTISAAALTNPFDSLTKDQDVQMGELMDDLDVAIAQCEYDKAVDVVEKRKLNSNLLKSVKALLTDQPPEAPKVRTTCYYLECRLPFFKIR